MFYRYGNYYLVALTVVGFLMITDAFTWQNADIKIELVSLRADDGGTHRGTLYWDPSKRPKTVVVAMHPRNDTQRHFTLQPAAQRGFAGYGMAGRWTGEDGIHEELLLDIARAVRYLKRDRGFTHVVLVGHSGGGSLMAFYQSQAETAPPGRYSSTPADDPPNLNPYEMLSADGIAILNASEGEGLHVEHHLDPSLVREDDPLSIDPSLDMYNPANGYRRPPEASKYSPEFIERFRAAQKARGQRLTEWARSQIKQRNYYQDLMNDPPFKNLPLEKQQFIERRAEHAPLMVLYRSEADLDYLDLSIDPSDRLVGSNYTPRPDLRNYSPDARLRQIRPEAFLSTMSGVTSRARLHNNIKKVTVSTLVLGGTADRGIFPREQKTTFANSGARDKTIMWIEGADHGFEPSGPKAGKGDQREQALNALFQWMEKRFPK